MILNPFSPKLVLNPSAIVSGLTIGISVPDVYQASKRFEELGVEFVKKPDDGKMKGLAFIKDPDGYWVEILSANGLAELSIPTD